MNFLIEKAKYLLEDHGFEYAFCGGLAIDLFVGAETRKHSDIDILAYWSERDTIILYMQSLGFLTYEMLGGGKAHHITDIRCQTRSKRNIFCCKSDCELVELSDTDETGIYYIDFKHIGQTKLNFIEFLFNDKCGNDLLYARNHDIRRPLNEAILHNGGIPYLSPEMCLLYKSTDTEREGYQHDYEVATAKMNEHQKQWLNSALGIMYPDGHKWRETKVELREITKDNLESVLKLKVAAMQVDFVSSNAYSLAQTWVYRKTAFPFAIYANDRPVGFLMLGYYELKNQYTLWKFMIDERYQGRGYGRKALELAINWLANKFNVKEVYTGVAFQNSTAEHLYYSFGFRKTGVVDESCSEMKLMLGGKQSEQYI